MTLQIISVLATRRRTALLVLILLLNGCGSTNAIYVHDHAPVAIQAPHRNYTNPDIFLVNPSDYPIFVAKRDFKPHGIGKKSVASDLPFVTILSTDKWYVTHKVGNLLLIYSNAYQTRECNAVWAHDKFSGSFKQPFGGSCISRYLYCLYISKNGRVFGWKRLINPKRVALSRDRYTNMTPPARNGLGWPKEPLLEPVL